MEVQVADVSLAVGGEGEITARPFLAVESILPGEACNHCTSAWQSLKSSEQSRCLVRKQRQKLRQMDWIVVGLGEEVFM